MLHDYVTLVFLIRFAPCTRSPPLLDRHVIGASACVPGPIEWGHLVLIAGKGQPRGLSKIGREVFHFDDKEVAREALAQVDK